MKIAPRRRALLVAVPFLALGAACSGTTTSQATNPPGTSTGSSPGSSKVTGTTNTTTPSAPFAGPGDFYDVPKPLPAGDPGALIRFQRVDTPTVEDRILWRVMYHSRDAQDHDVAVTGSVSVPTAAAPSGGWTTLAWGHGTGGLAPKCAGSRGTSHPPGFGVDGIITGTDYYGLGPNGSREAYLSREAEGHSVIDSVRAARQLPDVVASEEWVAVGISEGGFAVLSAAELTEAYAPELTLLGTAAMAPGTELDRSFPGDTPQVVAIVKAMAVYGLAVDHPDVHPEQYATPALQAATPKFDELCVDQLSAALLAIPPDGFWTTDPLTTDAGKKLSATNNPGIVVTTSPLLIVQGDKDIVVAPARTQAFYEKICGKGQVVSFVGIPGGDHNLRDDRAHDAVASWIQDRLAHRPATSTCP